MLDSDSHEAIRCPYCGSLDDCQHLLAVVDETFGECLGGYAFDRYFEFREMVEGTLRKLLRSKQPGNAR